MHLHACCCVCAAVFETLNFTTELFTHVAVQHPSLLELVVEHSNIVDVDWAVNTLAVSIASLEPDMDVSAKQGSYQQAGKQCEVTAVRMSLCDICLLVVLSCCSHADAWL